MSHGRFPNTVWVQTVTNGVAKIPVRASAPAAPGSLLTLRSANGSSCSISHDLTTALSLQPFCLYRVIVQPVASIIGDDPLVRPVDCSNITGGYGEALGNRHW